MSSKNSFNLSAFATLTTAALTLILLPSCGQNDDIRVPAAADEREAWEGISIWGVPAETAPLSVLTGSPVLVVDAAIEIGNWTWRINDLQLLDKGVAQAWPGIDEKWMVLHTELRPDTPAAGRSRLLIPSEVFVLIDDHGNRHLPSKVHERLVPRIDQKVQVDSMGAVFPILFSMKEDRVPAAIEIHEPLRTAVIPLATPPTRSLWQQVDRAVSIDDRELRSLWVAQLNRIRTEFTYDVPGRFEAELTFRNISGGPLLVPSPQSSRLYTATGRTIASAESEPIRQVASRETAVVRFAFEDVLPRQALTLLIQSNGKEISLPVNSQFPKKAPLPISSVFAPGGIRLAIYTLEHRGDSFAAFIGITNFNATDLPISELKVSGLKDDTPISLPGTIMNPPSILHPGQEERRWILFSEQAGGATFEFEGFGPASLHW